MFCWLGNNRRLSAWNLQGAGYILFWKLSILGFFFFKLQTFAFDQTLEIVKMERVVVLKLKHPDLLIALASFSEDPLISYFTAERINRAQLTFDI